MTLDETEVQRMVAAFMKASTPLETYLQQGGPLSPLQLDLVASTLAGLQGARKQRGDGLADSL